MEAIDNGCFQNKEKYDISQIAFFNQHDLERVKDMSFRLKIFSGSKYFKAIFIKASEMLLEIAESEDVEIQKIAIMRWKNWIKNLNIDIINFLYIVADDEALSTNLFFN